MSDASARPGGFVLRARYSRVECPEPDYEGLWAEIRTNLTNAERAAFVQALDEINAGARTRSQELIDAVADAERRVKAATDDAERRAANNALDAARKGVTAALAFNDPGLAANLEQRQALASPHIRAWNVCDDNGEPVPPPAEGGAASWAWVDHVIIGWLLSEIENGYRGGKGVRSSSAASNATPVPLSGPQIVDDAA